MRLCQNVVEFIVRCEHHSVNVAIPGALAIGQTQTTAHHLFTQDLGSGRAERNNGIEIVHVPALFEHIDVDNDFYRVLRIFDAKKHPRIRLCFRALLLGMDDNRLVSVCSILEFIGTDKTIYPCGMICVFADYEHKRLHNRLTVISGIDFQLAFCILMAGNTVQQHHLVKLLIAKIVKVNVGAGDGKRRPGVAVLNRLGERIFIHNILEGNLFIALGNERRGRQL